MGALVSLDHYLEYRINLAHVEMGSEWLIWYIVLDILGNFTGQFRDRTVICVDF